MHVIARSRPNQLAELDSGKVGLKYRRRGPHSFAETVLVRIRDLSWILVRAEDGAAAPATCAR